MKGRAIYASNSSGYRGIDYLWNVKILYNFHGNGWSAKNGWWMDFLGDLDARVSAILVWRNNIRRVASRRFGLFDGWNNFHIQEFYS